MCPFCDSFGTLFPPIVAGLVQGGVWLFDDISRFAHLEFLARCSPSVSFIVRTERLSVILDAACTVEVVVWLETVDVKALLALTEEMTGVAFVPSPPAIEKGSVSKLEVYGLENGGGGKSSLSSFPDPNKSLGS